jgi:queuine tRNA-ribosyltransferase
VEQSALAERLQQGTEPLVIWDVGLGAAANAMAAIECYEMLAAQGPVRPLQIVSFENDLDSLTLALRHREKFTYLRHGGPATLLKEGAWQSRTLPGLSWTLLQGDFMDLMVEAPAAPDLIYYDLFSSKSEPHQWTQEMFVKLLSCCQSKPAELFTYTTSTAARVSLLAAGFHVAHGQSSGAKVETTIALTPTAVAQRWGNQHRLLGKEWLARWERSQAKIPVGLEGSAADEFAARIRQHQQFVL